MMRTLFWVLEKTLKILLPFGLIGAGAYVAVWLIQTRPKAARAPIRIQPTLVEVIPARKTRERIRIYQNGTVVAAQSVVLSPEVNGRVIEQSPELVPGGRFETGDIILKIDPRDYQYAVEQKKSEVENALSNLKEEGGRQIIAKREWNLLGEDLETTEAGRELALRIPHLRKARASLAAAGSALQDAELDLERTTIRAPFNAFVQRESVDIGQIVTQQTQLATLIGTDRLWVQVSTPIEQLQWIRIPGIHGPEGSKAKVIQKGGNSTVLIEREGRVVRLLGDIQINTRTSRVLVAVDDPLGLEAKPGESSLPLLVGAFVDVEIEGIEVDDVFLVPWRAIREGVQVWIMDDNDRLAVRTVDILKSRPDDTVLVRDGLQEGDRIIVSPLSTPIPGMQLRVDGKPTEQVTQNVGAGWKTGKAEVKQQFPPPCGEG